MNITKKPKWIDKLNDVVKSSRCRTEVLQKLGLSTNGGGNHTIVKRWIEKMNINVSHFNYRQVISEKSVNTNKKVKYNDCDFLVERWFGSISPVKRWARINIEYKCECGNTGEWRGKKLSLQLDHKNGNNRDNRVENLRWICPNCHTQTETYGSKKLKVDWYCNNCGKKVSKGKNCCVQCNGKRRIKIKIPKSESVKKSNILDKSTLEEEVKKYPMTYLGKKYGVSDNAIRKWCKKYGIETNKGRGYWTKSKVLCQISNGSVGER